MADGTSFVLHVKGGMKEGVVSRVVSWGGGGLWGGVLRVWEVLVFSNETCGRVECAPISLLNPKAALISS